MAQVFEDIKPSNVTLDDTQLLTCYIESAQKSGDHIVSFDSTSEFINKEIHVILLKRYQRRMASYMQFVKTIQSFVFPSLYRSLFTPNVLFRVVILNL